MHTFTLHNSDDDLLCKKEFQTSPTKVEICNLLYNIDWRCQMSSFNELMLANGEDVHFTREDETGEFLDDSYARLEVR